MKTDKRNVNKYSNCCFFCECQLQEETNVMDIDI